MQTTDRYPMVDRVTSKPERHELLARHHPMLLIRKLPRLPRAAALTYPRRSFT